MKTRHLAPLLLMLSAAALAAPPEREASADTARPSASEIVAKVLDSDPWGLAGAEVKAHAIIVKDGKTKELAFEAKSRKNPQTHNAMSLISFTAPADIAGSRFLQIQTSADDDERHIYTPDLKRARRVAASNRGEAFMGTTFTYADLDRKDLRTGVASLEADETIGKHDCWRVDVVPKSPDIYTKIELWVAKDTMVPLKTVSYDKAGGKKILVAKEIQKRGGHYFMSVTKIADSNGSSTEIRLDDIKPTDDLPADLFTVRALERG